MALSLQRKPSLSRSFRDLPAEVMRIISSFLTSTSDLSAFRLVSKVCSSASDKQLFRSISFQPHAKSFSRLEDFAASPLSIHIRILKFHNGYLPELYTYDAWAMHMRAYAGHKLSTANDPLEAVPDVSHSLDAQTSQSIEACSYYLAYREALDGQKSFANRSYEDLASALTSALLNFPKLKSLFLFSRPDVSTLCQSSEDHRQIERAIEVIRHQGGHMNNDEKISKALVQAMVSANVRLDHVDLNTQVPSIFEVFNRSKGPVSSKKIQSAIPWQYLYEARVHSQYCWGGRSSEIMPSFALWLNNLYSLKKLTLESFVLGESDYMGQLLQSQGGMGSSLQTLILKGSEVYKDPFLCMLRGVRPSLRTLEIGDTELCGHSWAQLFSELRSQLFLQHVRFTGTLRDDDFGEWRVGFVTEASNSKLISRVYDYIIQGGPSPLSLSEDYELAALQWEESSDASFQWRSLASIQDEEEPYVGECWMGCCYSRFPSDSDSEVSEEGEDEGEYLEDENLAEDGEDEGGAEGDEDEDDAENDEADDGHGNAGN